MNICQIAEEYAIRCHESTNHKYDGLSYGVHLAMVVGIAMRWVHILPARERDEVIAACWCHDVIEDCRQTYNDVKKATNERVAEMVYALTNEKGKTRKDRANDKYYDGIKAVPYADFVKICDRIANVKYSKGNGGDMFFSYKKENIAFANHFFYMEEMMEELNSMFK